jgi:hypothetical protein
MPFASVALRKVPSASSLFAKPLHCAGMNGARVDSDSGMRPFPIRISVSGRSAPTEIHSMAAAKLQMIKVRE